MTKPLLQNKHQNICDFVSTRAERLLLIGPNLHPVCNIRKFHFFSFYYLDLKYSSITFTTFNVKLNCCIALNKHNTVFTSNRSAICNRCSLGPLESLRQTVSRSLPNFLQGSLGDRPTDRLTDHATRAFIIGGIYLCSTAM